MMAHDFSVSTEYMNFCARCGCADCRPIRRRPCVPVRDVRKVIESRLGYLRILFDATKKQRQGRHRKKR